MDNGSVVSLVNMVTPTYRFGLLPARFSHESIYGAFPMISQCPRCKNRLADFAVVCEKCAWSLIENQPAFVAPEVAQQQPVSVPTNRASKQFELALQNAVQWIEKEEFKSALSTLNQAIDMAPQERLSECYALRGFAQLKNCDFVRAEDDCSEAISLEWEEPQTFVWRAAARGEQNKWRLAFDDLDRACELAGDGRDPYLALMESYSESASEYFREQIQGGHESADLFFERGWMYLQAGQYQKAGRDFQHALKMQERHPWASVGLAELLLHDEIVSNVRELCDTGMIGGIECQRAALQRRAKLNLLMQNIGLAKQDIDQLTELAGDDPRELVECARWRGKLGDHVAAIDELNRVLAQAPNHRIALLLRGDCYQEIRNRSLALHDYSRYLQIYPDDVHAWVQRAKVLLAAGRFEKAHDDLDQALGVDSTNFEIYLIRSKAHLEEGKLDAALTECRRAVRLDNRSAEAFSVLASIFSQMGDYGNAIQEYLRSIDLAETTDEKAQYLYLCGIAHYELGDFEQSLMMFHKSCQLRPNHAGGWIWKAAAFSRIEKWSSAILGLQQAILVRPSAAEQYQKLGKPIAEKAIAYFRRQQKRGVTKPKLFRNRGMAYQFIGHDPEAVVDYTTALSREPGDVETLLRRGQVFTRMSDHESAIKDFTTILETDKSNHQARYCRAIVRLAEGDHAQAKRDLEKAIRIAPHHPSYHILLGELLQTMGDEPGVIAAFEKAILQDPTNPISYRKRGMAHLNLGHYLAAINDFTRSLELNPQQLDLLVKRGQAYLRTNQPLMAIEDFELALTHNDRLIKAYSGRATVLVQQDRHEYALIWLTKAMHRFEQSRDLAEIVFARGKIFYEMGRAAPAMTDFTSVMELLKSNNRKLTAARYARAIAALHAEKFEIAERDFRRLVADFPNTEHFRGGLQWLADREQPLPSYLGFPKSLKRPTRPPVVRNGVELSEKSLKHWETEPLYDSWIVRTADKIEFGPVHLSTLQTWASEGRLGVGMKLLRADWSKWQRVAKIFAEITPAESNTGLMEEFPELKIGSPSVRQLPQSGS